MTVGSAIAITGAGLQIIGEEVLLLGNEMHRSGTGRAVVTKPVAPNGPPTLD
jgi:hypothetical protein